MEYDSKGTDDWSKMVTSAHVDRWVGFTFNPTPLDLVSNSHIRAVGRVVDALYSSEFEKIVSPLRALYPLVSDANSIIVAVLARMVRDAHYLDASTIVQAVSSMGDELEDSINAAPKMDASRKRELSEVIESVAREVKAFLKQTITEADAICAQEKQLGVSCLPGEPSIRELHKLYYPPVKHAPSPWQRLASDSERRPINTESADVVGAPREDVPVVEHVYAQGGISAGNERE